MFWRQLDIFFECFGANRRIAGVFIQNFKSTMPSRLPSRTSKIFRRLQFDTPASASYKQARHRINKRDKNSVLFEGVEIVLRDFNPPRSSRSKKQWDKIREGAKSIIAAVRAWYGNNITKIILHNGALVQVFVGSAVAKPIASYAESTSTSLFDCRTSLGSLRARAASRAFSVEPFDVACPAARNSEDLPKPPDPSKVFVVNAPNAAQTLDSSSLDLKELLFNEEWDNIQPLENATLSSLCLSPNAASAAALSPSRNESDKEFVIGISDGVLCGVSETPKSFEDEVFEDLIMNISEVCV